MACRLFGAKPLSKPMLVIVNWTLRNKLQWNFNQHSKSSFTKMHLKISSAKWQPFCPGGDELRKHEETVLKYDSSTWKLLVPIVGNCIDKHYEWWIFTSVKKSVSWITSAYNLNNSLYLVSSYYKLLCSRKKKWLYPKLSLTARALITDSIVFYHNVSSQDEKTRWMIL